MDGWTDDWMERRATTFIHNIMIVVVVLVMCPMCVISAYPRPCPWPTLGQRNPWAPAW